MEHGLCNMMKNPKAAGNEQLRLVGEVVYIRRMVRAREEEPSLPKAAVHIQHDSAFMESSQGKIAASWLGHGEPSPIGNLLS